MLEILRFAAWSAGKSIRIRKFCWRKYQDPKVLLQKAGDPESSAQRTTPP
jgi:hypothetical protein